MTTTVPERAQASVPVPERGFQLGDVDVPCTTLPECARVESGPMPEWGVGLRDMNVSYMSVSINMPECARVEGVPVPDVENGQVPEAGLSGV